MLIIRKVPGSSSAGLIFRKSEDYNEQNNKIENCMVADVMKTPVAPFTNMV